MIDILKEAREAFYSLHPEYDTANGGTYMIHDKVLNALNELDRLQKKETPMKPLHVMFTWQCKECGSELRDTWNFCPHCGKQLDWSDEK